MKVGKLPVTPMTRIFEMTGIECKNCGLPIQFRPHPANPNKMAPYNPDGSMHFELCKKTLLEKQKALFMEEEELKRGYAEINCPQCKTSARSWDPTRFRCQEGHVWIRVDHLFKFGMKYQELLGLPINGPGHDLMSGAKKSHPQYGVTGNGTI